MTSNVQKNIALFGPQGSGKGTQAEKLSAYFGIPHVSPGNIFRKAVADQTELGKQVQSILEAGNLVPDQITNSLMKERIEQEDCVEGFIFDGYPRNIIQADAMDKMTTLTHVMIIDVPDEESIRRLTQRRVCMQCGATYHLEFKKPVQEGVCDVCGSELILRDDDKSESIRKRLDIYHTETQPLFTRYEERGIVCRVDGMGSIEEVWQRVLNCFQ